MIIKVINKSDNPMPRYETRNSAGFDLASNEEMYLQPHEWKLIKTGLFMEIPVGFEGQVRPRSGMALKQGLTVLNAPGTIDSDYRGEIGVILHNVSGTSKYIRKGDRIAQMVISPIVLAALAEHVSLEETDRGEGGFGSTGTN